MKKINATNAIFFLSYSCFLFIIMYNNVSFLQNVFKYINLLGCLLLVLILIVQNDSYSFKTFFKNISVISISLIVFFAGVKSNRTDYYFVELFLLLFFSKKILLENIIKFDFIFKIVNILIIVFLAKVGIIENLVFLRDGITREALGFTHPNVFAALLVTCNIDMLYLSTKNNNYKKITIIFSVLSLIIISVVANSRSSFLLLIFMLFVYIFEDKKIVKSIKYIKHIVIFLFPICCITSLYLTHLFSINNDFGIIVNKILSERLYFNSIYLKNHNLNLFGNALYFTGFDALHHYGHYNMILDNSYIYILLRFGMISIILFSILFYFLLKKLYKEKKYFLIYVFVAFFLYGMFERHSFVVFYNPFLMCIKYIIYKKEGVEKDEI